MHFAGLSPLGRVATWLATLGSPPFYGRIPLSRMCGKGFISPRATVHHVDLQMGAHVFVDDGVLIYRDTDGGPVHLGDGVHIHRDTIIQTGSGGRVTLGPHATVQPRCQFSAYKGAIHIGRGVDIAPNCAFYPYSHGMAAGEPISAQPLATRGGIAVGDGAWLGVGVIVLDGARIGRGAVVGAGSVVTGDLPDGAVAVGAPARVIRMRGE